MTTKALSRKVQLILNGKAAGIDALRNAIEQQRAVGHRIKVRVTVKKGDARRFAAEAGEAELLIAAGGDGTLNEVVHGLMDLSEGARPALGIVPLGTANDFANGCGIPPDSEKALALCMEGHAVPIDIGKANEHWFLNAASVGFGAEVTATTPPELKRLLGHAAYTVMGAILATNVHHYHGRLILPDREITGSGPVAIVGNGRQTGGGLQVAPLWFVRSRRLRYSPRRESCKSFRQMASTSLIGKLPGLRSTPRKPFRSTWMASQYSFQAFDMKQ